LKGHGFSRAAKIFLLGCHPERSDFVRAANEITQSRDLLFARAALVAPANSRSLHSPLARLGRDDKYKGGTCGTTEVVPCYKADREESSMLAPNLSPEGGQHI